MHDLAMHPPQQGFQAIVLRFHVPVTANYTITDVAAKRSPTAPCNGTVNFYVFDENAALVAQVSHAGNDTIWTENESTFDIGSVTAGSYLYFALDADGDWACDASQCRFRITATGTATSTTTSTTHSIKPHR